MYSNKGGIQTRGETVRRDTFYTTNYSIKHAEVAITNKPVAARLAAHLTY